MISFNSRGIRIGEVWFRPPSDEDFSSGHDVIFFFQAPHTEKLKNAVPFLTSVVDLHKSEEEIFSAIRKNTVYQIRRAEDRDHVKFELFVKPSKEIFGEFLVFFNDFACFKGLGLIRGPRVESYRQAGTLALSRMVSDTDGAVVSWHAYFVGEGRSRLLYSASLRAGKGTDETARIGRVNRYHHWLDICEFKKLGFDVYDFGGISKGDDPAAAGIRWFKEGFGGEHEESDYGIAAVSWKGKGYLFLRNLLKR